MNVIPYPDAARSVNVGPVQPYTIEHEARFIVWLAMQTTGSILEIGCAQGYVTKALAIACPDRTVYAVDWTRNPGLSEHQQAERPDVVASRALHLPNVIAIDGDSKRLEYPDGIGFIFVDGDHTPEGVQADTHKVLKYRTANWERDLVIAWHDYRPESQWQGVATLLHSLAESGMLISIIEGTPIAVLGWPTNN